MCKNCKGGSSGQQASPLIDGTVSARLPGGLLQVRLSDGRIVAAEDRTARAYEGAQVSVAQTASGYRVH